MAVLAAHPHVVQPWEKIEKLTDDLGQTKDRFIIYSLGNFIANQGSGKATMGDVKKRTGMILHLGLTKNKTGTFINGVKYFPYYVTTSSSGPSRLRVAMGLNHAFGDVNAKLKSFRK